LPLLIFPSIYESWERWQLIPADRRGNGNIKRWNDVLVMEPGGARNEHMSSDGSGWESLPHTARLYIFVLEKVA
jgi:hypothetical protein